MPGKALLFCSQATITNERGMQTLLLTPEIDSRYEVGQITSRIGLSNKAFAFGPHDNIFTLMLRIKLPRIVNQVRIGRRSPIPCENSST